MRGAGLRYLHLQPRLAKAFVGLCGVALCWRGRPAGRRAARMVLWFNPSWQLSPTQPLAHSSHRWDGGENRKGKSRKLLG